MHIYIYCSVAIKIFMSRREYGVRNWMELTDLNTEVLNIVKTFVTFSLET